MTTTDTRSQLLREIAARPDDDTLRLAFADWLDEHGDAADRDRAEFVRVQCELEGMPAYRGINISLDWSDPGFSPECRRAVNLRRRETDLLDAHPEWSRCVCPECEGKGKVIGESIYGYSRERERCLTCGGTGDLFLGFGVSGASKTPPTKPRTVTFARGFADAVSCTLAEAFGGDGTPTAWAIEVVKQTPVTRVVPTDREPWDFGGTDRQRGWWREGGPQVHNRATVPAPVFDEIKHETVLFGAKAFRTAEAAADALALAAGRLVRRHAHKERT